MLGSLIEKQLTTPDVYPLSLNALVLACNQATNREPVMAVTAGDAEVAMAGLKERRLARFVHPVSGRGVTKYRQVSEETMALEPDELALIALLLLRGPQTPGELRGRSERLHTFETVADAEASLEGLAARDEPLVERLERQPGQSQVRWRQLVAEEDPRLAAVRAAPADSAPAVSLSSRVAELEERVSRMDELEERVNRLEEALAELL